MCLEIGGRFCGGILAGRRMENEVPMDVLRMWILGFGESYKTSLTYYCLFMRLGK